MSLIEGGNWKCNIHPEDNIDTNDVNEWNEHCRNTEGHTDGTVTHCTDCGAELDFFIPYQNIRDGKTKDIALKCENCFNSNQSLNRLALDISQQARQSKGEQQ